MHPVTETLFSSPSTQSFLPPTVAGPLPCSVPGRTTTTAGPKLGRNIALSPSSSTVSTVYP